MKGKGKYMTVHELIHNIESEEELDYAQKLLLTCIKEKGEPWKHIQRSKNGAIKVERSYSAEIREYLESRGFSTNRRVSARQKIIGLLKESKKEEEKEEEKRKQKDQARVSSYNIHDGSCKISSAARRNLIEKLEQEEERNPSKRYYVGEITSSLNIPLKFVRTQTAFLGEYDFYGGGYRIDRVLELAKKFAELERLATMCNVYKPL